MSAPRPSTVTTLLIDLQSGRDGALEQLMPLLYDELRALAAHYLRSERDGHTLQPTALVHEAFLRLVDQRTATWQNKAHFVGVAAQAMRRVIMDHARRRGAQKRGRGQFVTLGDDVAAGEPAVDLVRLDEALRALEALDPRQGRVVELRYFGGLSIGEAAEVLGVSPATVKRDWLLAKAWLFRALGGEAP